MQFSKFAVLLATASAAIAAPVDVQVDAGTGSALVARQGGLLNLNLGLGAGLNLGALNLGGILSGILGGLPNPVSTAQVIAILNSLNTGITAAQAAVLAQAQAALTALGTQITAAQNDLLQRINVALALVGTVPGTLQGTVTTTLPAAIAGLSAQVQNAIRAAIATVGVPAVTANGAITLRSQ